MVRLGRPDVSHRLSASKPSLQSQVVIQAKITPSKKSGTLRLKDFDSKLHSAPSTSLPHRMASPESSSACAEGVCWRSDSSAWRLSHQADPRAPARAMMASCGAQREVLRIDQRRKSQMHLESFVQSTGSPSNTYMNRQSEGFVQRKSDRNPELRK